MSVVDLLLRRRTVRNFDSNFEVPREKLEKIVQAALDSPTSRNQQEIDLIVITNREKIREIGEATYGTFSKEVKARYDARRSRYNVSEPVTCDSSCVILLVKNSRENPPVTTGIDAGGIMLSIMVAAQSFDINSMALGSIVCSKVEEVMSIPKGSLILGVSLGVPQRLKPLLDKKEILAKATYIE